MASVWYPKAFDLMAEGDLDLLVDDLRVFLVDAADYTFANTHDFLDDVPSGARVGTPTALASKTSAYSSNVWTFDAADTTLTSVTGDQSEAVIIYKHTGTDSTSPLVLYLELSSAVTPNGGNITLQYNASGLGTITATGA